VLFLRAGLPYQESFEIVASRFAPEAVSRRASDG
jgi:hypothetical protein